MRGWLAAYEEKRDLIALGAYKAGADPRTDQAIARIDAINEFLQQGSHESADAADTRARLLRFA